MMCWLKDDNKLLKQLFVDNTCMPDNCDPKYLEQFWLQYPIFNYDKKKDFIDAYTNEGQVSFWAKGSCTEGHLSL
jgi:hypothetical protein